MTYLGPGWLSLREGPFSLHLLVLTCWAWSTLLIVTSSLPEHSPWARPWAKSFTRTDSMERSTAIITILAAKEQGWLCPYLLPGGLVLLSSCSYLGEGALRLREGY